MGGGVVSMGEGRHGAPAVRPWGQTSPAAGGTFGARGGVRVRAGAACADVLAIDASDASPKAFVDVSRAFD